MEARTRQEGLGGFCHERCACVPFIRSGKRSGFVLLFRTPKSQVKGGGSREVVSRHLDAACKFVQPLTAVDDPCSRSDGVPVHVHASIYLLRHAQSGLTGNLGTGPVRSLTLFSVWSAARLVKLLSSES